MGSFCPIGTTCRFISWKFNFKPIRPFIPVFFSEIFLYLHQTELSNDLRGAVIYPGRSIDNAATIRYSDLLEHGRVSRFYLDELGDTGTVSIETLKLIIESETRAIERGRALLQQVRREFPDPIRPREILKLIETILIYKLPRMSRREIEAMFSLSDLRQTRVYQEGREEGREEEKIATVRRLSALGLSAE